MFEIFDTITTLILILVLMHVVGTVVFYRAQRAQQAGYRWNAVVQYVVVILFTLSVIYYWIRFFMELL